NLINTTATTLNVGGAATTLNLAGGSGSTGCTIDGSGNLACSGTITGGTPLSLQSAYNGGSTILTTNGNHLEVTLANTATDPNFIIDIASGSTSEFQIEANNVDVLQIGAAGQLQLDVQGSSGGILLGGDVHLYRSGANILSLGTDDNLRAINTAGD